MKKIILPVLLGLLMLSISCKNEQSSTQKLDSVQEIVELNAQYTGEITENDLINSTYTNRWFTPGKTQYVPHEASMKTIQENIGDYTIEVFMGTWCPDSQREIPRFYKILDETDFNQSKNLKLYTLDHGMHSESGEEKGKNIIKVPTIIFYKDGKEVNRFVEHPRESITRDMAKIVSGKPYKNYHE